MPTEAENRAFKLVFGPNACYYEPSRRPLTYEIALQMLTSSSAWEIRNLLVDVFEWTSTNTRADLWVDIHDDLWNLSWGTWEKEGVPLFKAYISAVTRVVPELEDML